MSNDDIVLLDLNVPRFQKTLFDLDAAEQRRVIKTLRKILGMTWHEVFSDHGLKWEQVKGQPGTYTIRVSQSYRVTVERAGAFMLFQTLHPDHDSAYGKK